MADLFQAAHLGGKVIQGTLCMQSALNHELLFPTQFLIICQGCL